MRLFTPALLFSIIWSSTAASAERIFFDCKNATFVNSDGLAVALSGHFAVTVRFNDSAHVSVTIPRQTVCDEMRGAATENRILVYCDKVEAGGVKRLRVLSIDRSTGEFQHFLSTMQANDSRNYETKTTGHCIALERPGHE